MSGHTAPGQNQSFKYTCALALAALGIVFGDIGTSPLYAVQQCFHNFAHGGGGHGGGAATAINTAGDTLHLAAGQSANIYGVLSLITWALIIVVTVKYLIYVMRADNRGEGGVLALLALALMGKSAPKGRMAATMLLVGLFGTCLLYGDGVITPAISVISAIEGLQEANLSIVGYNPADYVVPITIVILIGLFAMQRFGTAKVGFVFGPITTLWFIVLILLGLPQIIKHPEVLQAFSPHHAVIFIPNHGLLSFYVIGAVFLVVTGGEALYADMGHFGRRPIRLAWFALVLPGLLINYYGQGALILNDPTAYTNPFFKLAPQWAKVPLVILAACAAVIASQALISGAFSVTRQAIQLGYCPPMKIVQTSEKEIGQIYIPVVNWLLMVMTLMLVVMFRTSASLAQTYGIAVSITMVITVLLLYMVARRHWGWSLWKCVPLLGLFLIVDLALLAANATKIPRGGYVPLGIAAGVMVLLTTWKKGRTYLKTQLAAMRMPLPLFLQSLRKNPPHRVPGTAVFLTSDPEGTPGTLLHNLKHNKILHERVIFMTFVTEEYPLVEDADRVKVEDLGEDTWRVIARYGFMESPSVPAIMKVCREAGVEFDIMHTTFFLGHEKMVISNRKTGMIKPQKALYAWMAKNARNPAEIFNVPPNRVVELGAQVEI